MVGIYSPGNAARRWMAWEQQTHRRNVFLFFFPYRCRKSTFGKTNKYHCRSPPPPPVKHKNTGFYTVFCQQAVSRQPARITSAVMVAAHTVLLSHEPSPHGPDGTVVRQGPVGPCKVLLRCRRLCADVVTCLRARAGACVGVCVCLVRVCA